MRARRWGFSSDGGSCPAVAAARRRVATTPTASRARGGSRSPLARRTGTIFSSSRGDGRVPPRDADEGVARTARKRTLNSRSTGRMQLHSSGRNVSGSAWRLWIICLTHFLCTARLTCASLRIFPTVGTVMATATDARWRVERVSRDGTAGACVRARARSSKRGEGLARRSFDCGAAGRGRDDEPLRPQYFPGGPLESRKSASHKPSIRDRYEMLGTADETALTAQKPRRRVLRRHKPAPMTHTPAPMRHRRRLRRRIRALRHRDRRRRVAVLLTHGHADQARRRQRHASSRREEEAAAPLLPGGGRERASMSRRRVTTTNGEATRTRQPA